MRKIRRMRTLRGALVALLVAALGVALWWRRNPSACPYSQRFWVELPHPFITRERLVEVLEPKPRDRLLEVGPGTGHYTFHVAERLERGRLELYDLQQEMLDLTMKRGAERGVSNLTAWQGDAT